jgi:hypothetical protein
MPIVGCRRRNVSPHSEKASGWDHAPSNACGKGPPNNSPIGGNPVQSGVAGNRITTQIESRRVFLAADRRQITAIANPRRMSMAIPNDPETLLRRVDAAHALREAGYPIARATLATLGALVALIVYNVGLRTGG